MNKNKVVAYDKNVRNVIPISPKYPKLIYLISNNLLSTKPYPSKEKIITK